MDPLVSANLHEWTGVAVRTASVLVGLGLLWAAIMAAVGVMLVPRPSNQKLALWVSRVCQVFFKAISLRARNYEQLDRLLAVQGPTTVLLYLALFLGIFVTAFSFLFYGATGCSPMAAFYRAGSGMSTLGMVDITGAPGYISMFVAAFTGTTVVSVFIGFLLTLYSAYTARETHMSKLAMACGEPGWGPEMAVRLQTLKVDWTAEALDENIHWLCAMRVSQYLYPLLNHFRSPVRDRHWTVSLLALLDAAALRLTCLAGERDLNVVRLLAQGSDTFHALKLSEMARTDGGVSEGAMLTWIIEEELLADHDEGSSPDPGITREEWDKAMDFMASHGVEVRGDRDAAWRAFSRVRCFYVEPAYFLTNHLSAINAPWSGPRHPAYEFPLVYPRIARKTFAPAAADSEPSKPDAR
jgi:hypothetical protein